MAGSVTPQGFGVDGQRSTHASCCHGQHPGRRQGAAGRWRVAAEGELRPRRSPACKMRLRGGSQTSMNARTSPNCAYLAHHDARLVALATQAEEHFASDPTVTLFKLRQFGEVLAQRAAAKVGLCLGGQEGQQQLIDRLWDRSVIGATPPLLEKLRQSILAEAFRGDITKDWRAKQKDVEAASKLLERIRVPTRGGGRMGGRSAVLPLGLPKSDRRTLRQPGRLLVSTKSHHSSLVTRSRARSSLLRVFDCCGESTWFDSTRWDDFVDLDSARNRRVSRLRAALWGHRYRYGPTDCLLRYQDRAPPLDGCPRTSPSVRGSLPTRGGRDRGPRVPFLSGACN